MKTATPFVLAAGFAALAACTVNENDNNTATADMNAAVNTADSTLPPTDINAVNADINVGTTNDVANDTTMANNSAANTTNEQ